MKLLAKENDTFQVCVLHEWATISTVTLKEGPRFESPWGQRFFCCVVYVCSASVWEEAGAHAQSKTMHLGQH